MSTVKKARRSPKNAVLLRSSEKIVGVYKLIYIPTKQFYIGSSTNIYARFAVHKSRMKHNKHSNSIQQLYNITKNIADWKIEIVELCNASQLVKKEEHHLRLNKKSLLLLNKQLDGRTGKRGIATKEKTRYKIAAGLLGKNSPDHLISRPANLVFIAPDGTLYPNIQSVKQFAETHNLLQSAMNHLANGKISQIQGWTIENGHLPNVALVHDIWPRERLLQYYDEYVILDPENNIHTAFSLYHFEVEHNVSVALPTKQNDTKKILHGLNDIGQGWRSHTTPSYTIVWNGITYKNIISIGKFCEAVGIKRKRVLLNYLKGNAKNKRNYHIEKETLPLHVQQFIEKLGYEKESIATRRKDIYRR